PSITGTARCSAQRAGSFASRGSSIARPQSTQRECAGRDASSSQGTGTRSVPQAGHESPSAYSVPQRSQVYDAPSGVSMMSGKTGSRYDPDGWTARGDSPAP